MTNEVQGNGALGPIMFAVYSSDALGNYYQLYYCENGEDVSTCLTK